MLVKGRVSIVSYIPQWNSIVFRLENTDDRYEVIISPESIEYDGKAINDLVTLNTLLATHATDAEFDERQNRYVRVAKVKFTSVPDAPQTDFAKAKAVLQQ